MPPPFFLSTEPLHKPRPRRHVCFVSKRREDRLSVALANAVSPSRIDPRLEGTVQSSSSCLWRPSARTVLILYLSFSACTSWRPDTLSPQAVVQSHPSSLRVTYADSSSVVISNPQLQGDTIVGLNSKMTKGLRVPLDTVVLTETRHGDAGKTVLTVLGVAAAAFAVAAVAFVISCNQTGCMSSMKR